mmetsp:Transcript_24022/g.62652  ORF Transcript_24022/g.62652 Transcript_24022/m.62652 type:complete len:225 (-) Transcript_24022:234-908(-)
MVSRSVRISWTSWSRRLLVVSSSLLRLWTSRRRPSAPPERSSMILTAPATSSEKRSRVSFIKFAVLAAVMLATLALSCLHSRSVFSALLRSELTVSTTVSCFFSSSAWLSACLRTSTSSRRRPPSSDSASSMPVWSLRTCASSLHRLRGLSSDRGFWSPSNQPQMCFTERSWVSCNSLTHTSILLDSSSVWSCARWSPSSTVITILLSLFSNTSKSCAVRSAVF